MNFPRRHEPVATDTIFSGTPAVDSGVKQAQVFLVERFIGGRCIPNEIWQAVCQYTGRQHQEQRSHGQIIE